MSIDRLLDIAHTAVGLTQDDAPFQALCGPGEPPERAMELARLSTCALFLRGCLAWALSGRGLATGPTEPPPGVPSRLWAPYLIGYAMTDLVAVHQVALAACWMVPPTPDETTSAKLRERVAPGVIVIVGRSEHVYLIERLERDGWPDGSIEVVAIEAGQRDAQGRQCVRRKKHAISPQCVDMAWSWPLTRAGGSEGQPPIPLPGAGDPKTMRRVTWVLDPRALLEDL